MMFIRTNIFFPAILIFALRITLAFAETEVYDTVSGVWNQEGSPYYVVETVTIPEGDTLTIEPGVRVMFDRYEGMLVSGTLLAQGIAGDSIIFEGVWGERWRCIMAYPPRSIIYLDYCVLKSAWGWYEFEGAVNQDYSPDSLVIKNSRFTECFLAIKAGTISDLRVDNCLFERNNAGIYINNGTNAQIRRSIFIPAEFNQYEDILFRSDSMCVISKCLFFDSRVICSSNNLSFDYSIFEGNTRISHPGNEDGSSFAKYSCFNIGGNINWVEDIIDDFAILDRVNANGDSTDRYGNLFREPGIVGPIDDEWQWPASFQLTEDSPCIDAGDPESPRDPDGTIVDIGPFFFPQGNIEITPDTLFFADVELEGIDSLAVRIRNIGLDSLNVTDLSIIPFESPFSISLGTGEFALPPEATHPVWVVFLRDDVFEQSAILLIESDDRDQGVFEVQLVASALGVENDFILPPSSFILLEAYPNPFNSRTTVRFTLPQAGRVSLSLYDPLGRKVRDLMPGGWMGAGNYRLGLSAEDLSSGVYLVRLEKGGQALTTPLNLVR